ncbi:MAG: NAD(P)/FAD-dependent oxidoreductase, partial [Chloroflexota bacterium]|nr:NAD(P)/FAD-dependent oxidoreductase [Chloroflexota bacterium]
MSDKLYDVIVVGAGPAGSYTAYKLAASGYSVAVLEQKDAAGLDVCCTGIISAECFSSFDISADVVLGRTGSATFFSPSGKSAKVRSGKALACVVERASFDGAIASKAQCQGVRYFFSHQVTDIVSGKEDIRAEALCQGSREVFSARALVLANGFQPGLPGKLGLGRINSFLIGAQAEIEIEGLEGIEVYFMPQMEAGVFAWMVPTSAGKALVGLLARTEARSSLTEFLLGPFCQGRVATGGVEIRQKAIPLGTLPRSYGERVLVVGDAAGQVKPTTGGGIYLGHL